MKTPDALAGTIHKGIAQGVNLGLETAAKLMEELSSKLDMDWSPVQQRECVASIRALKLAADDVFVMGNTPPVTLNVNRAGARTVKKKA